jgi:phage baseplate assembly protein W
MITYSGFSTKVNLKRYKLNDFELVKQDLKNYLSIRRGEKLMQPKFGTIIWEMLFEPLNQDTEQLIIQDINKIAAYDPRLTITQVAIAQQDTGLLIDLTLIYNPTNQQEVLSLNFNRNTQRLTTN